jgi:hypothetical protein
VLHWHDLSDVIEYGGFESKYANASPVQLTWLIEKFSRPLPQGVPAIEAFKYCCNSECKDLRDKVYGLQALVVQDERVVVDYSMSVNDVFISAMSKLLERGERRGWWLESVSDDLSHLALAMGLDLDESLAVTLSSRNAQSPLSIERDLLHVISSREPLLFDDDGYLFRGIDGYISEGIDDNMDSPYYYDVEEVQNPGYRIFLEELERQEEDLRQLIEDYRG